MYLKINIAIARNGICQKIILIDSSGLNVFAVFERLVKLLIGSGVLMKLEDFEKFTLRMGRRDFNLINSIYSII